MAKKTELVNRIIQMKKYLAALYPIRHSIRPIMDFISHCIIGWLVLLALLILNLYISDPPKFYRSPTALFPIQKAANTFEVKLQIGEERAYQFVLEFMFKEHDALDRARVAKLVGDAPSHTERKVGDTYVSERVFKKNFNPGVPTPVRLKINFIGNDGERPIFDREIKDLVKTGWSADYFTKELATIHLVPGNYRVIIESLRDSPELVGTDVTLSIGTNPKTVGANESWLKSVLKLFLGALGITYIFL